MSTTQFPSKLKELIKNAFGIDYRSMALLRMGTALAILINLAGRIPDLLAFYSDEGCVPRISVLQLADSPWYFSIYHSTGNFIMVALLFAIAAILALMLFAGYWTRIATIASWVFLVSLQNRNPMIIDGQDMLLRMMLFWGMFLPWGNYLSLDSARNRRVPTEKIICSIATFAYTIQILLIYLCTALHKNSPEWTIDGTAGLYSLNIDFVTTPLGVFLTNFPDFLKVMTFATLLVELACPLLLIVPWTGGLTRIIAIAALSCFQTGLSLIFKLGFFPLFNILSLSAFIPTSVWEFVSRLSKQFPGLEKIRTSLYTASTRLPHLKPALSLPSHQLAVKSKSVAYNLTVGFFLLYVWLWNVSGLPGSGIQMPAIFQPIGNFFRLDQSWFMFAGFHPHLNGWYVMPGKLKNGKTVDIFRNGAEVSWERPRLISNDYPNYQWRIYLVALFNHSYLKWRPYYAAYLCRQWNKTHSQEEQLEHLLIYYMYEGPLPETNPADRANPTKLFVWEEKYCKIE